MRDAPTFILGAFLYNLDGTSTGTNMTSILKLSSSYIKNEVCFFYRGVISPDCLFDISSMEREKFIDITMK